MLWLFPVIVICKALVTSHPNFNIWATTAKRRRPSKSRRTETLALDGKSSKGSPDKEGEVFFLRRALREVTQRANCKGSNNPYTRVRGKRKQSSSPLHSYYSTSAFKPQTRSPSARFCSTKWTCHERELSSPIQVHQRLIGTDWDWSRLIGTDWTDWDWLDLIGVSPGAFASIKPLITPRTGWPQLRALFQSVSRDVQWREPADWASDAKHGVVLVEAL